MEFNGKKETEIKRLRYFEKHHIVYLFQQLFASIAYFQPEDPYDYIDKFLHKMVVNTSDGKSWLSAVDDFTPYQDLPTTATSEEPLHLQKVTIESIED